MGESHGESAGTGAASGPSWKYPDVPLLPINAQYLNSGTIANALLGTGGIDSYISAQASDGGLAHFDFGGASGFNLWAEEGEFPLAQILIKLTDLSGQAALVALPPAPSTQRSAQLTFLG